MPEDERPSPADPVSETLRLLAEGDVEIEGRLPWSSNHTFLATVRLGERSTGAVYKPGRGERMLWDFPGALYRREVAAFEVSRSLGLDLVPETVLRFDAPFGEGSLQRFVDADFSEHYFSLLEDESRHDALRRIGAFDLLLNNADRKGGHCLLGNDGRIWAIDHGLCFHSEPKLRTVIWDFAGEPVPAEVVEACRCVSPALEEVLAGLLDEQELAAFGKRARAIARGARFPSPSGDYRHYPWPLV